MGEQKVKKIKQDEALKEAEKQLAEIEAHKKPAAKGVAVEVEEKEKPTKVVVKPKKKKIRSKRYQEIASYVDKTRAYPLDEGLDILKKTAKSKFDESVEVHLKLLAKKGKGEDGLLRGVVQLPHGTGKKLEVIVLDDKTIAEIEKNKKVAMAAIYLAASEQLGKTKKIAKILGPKGKMPNPKYGTVGDNLDEMKQAIEKGRVEYRADAGLCVHQMLGKISWENPPAGGKLKENYSAFVNHFPANRIKAITLTSTMGPGIKVAK